MKRYNYIFILLFLFSLPSFGQSNIDCSNATSIDLIDCQEGFMGNPTIPAITGTCSDSIVQSLWYQYEASQSGILYVKSQAQFNDEITIFTGSCADLNLIACSNKDEYGFDGEQVYLEIASGSVYYIQLSNIKDEFATRNDSFCLQLSLESVIPVGPTNDKCSNAIALEIEGDNIPVSNRNATTGLNFPTNEERSRSDVWFSFMASVDNLKLHLNGDFSSLMTVYNGNCEAMSQQYSTGSSELFMPDLIIGDPYLVQVSGNFATIEGDAFLNLITTNPDLNVDCNSQKSIEINSLCTPFSNQQQSFSGIQANCEFGPAADLWFSFIAPSSNGVKIRTEADFLHSIALYEGACENLDNIFCERNPRSCKGYTEIENLTSGQQYFLQIMSSKTSFGYLEGSGCLEILDISQGGSFIPLSMNVDPFCLSIDEAQLEIEWVGGEGDIVFEGNYQHEILANGETYMVKATDAKGCVQLQKGEVSCDVEGACEIFYFLGTNPTTCAGEDDGSAFLDISGDSNVSFSWPNGDTTNYSNNLSQGTYNVTITNSEDCSFEVLFQIDSPASFISAETVINSTSEEATDGMITLVASGGTPPYSYSWVDGSNLATLSNISAGDYPYTITDVNDCSVEGLATVITVLACPENQILTLDIENNVQECYAAREFLSSSSTISSPAKITYKAGTKIRLLDGFRASAGTSFVAKIESCAIDLDQDGYFSDEDCDDNNALINPGQEENPYNGIDDDCNPETLDDDLDQDGFNLAEDCDDENPEVNPLAEEIPYNGIDDDCDPETFDDDLDQDGFDLEDDCDDNNLDVNPDAPEITYNGIDDDCNPETLDDDLDQDGFDLVDDCDDTNPEINPEIIETPYNGIDDDCNAETLDDDLDQDGFVLADDCDDTNPDINPDAEEIPNNGIDEDCDGMDIITSTHELSDVIINIYPNPIMDVININVQGDLDYELTLLDVSGKVIHSCKNKDLINASAIPKGTYLLEIKDVKTDIKVVEKIIKAK